MELERLGRILQLKWHFKNEANEFDMDQFKPKSILIRVIKMQPLKYSWNK